MLESMSVGKRLALVVLIAVLGLVSLAGFALMELRKAMEGLEGKRVQHIVEATVSVLDHYHDLESRKLLDRDEAQRQALAQLRRLRYDGNNYVFVYDRNAITVLSPIKPETEGQSMAGKTDSDGRPIFDRFAEIARSGESSIVGYVWPRSAGAAPERKASYVAAFAPWGWAIGSGVYLNAVDSAFQALLIKDLFLTTAILAVLVGLSTLVARSVLRQLGGEPADAVAIMERVAQGDLRVQAGSAARSNSLLGALGGMASRLRDLMANVGRGAELVASDTGSIAAGTRQVADAAHVQSDATSSIAAAVEQMTVSISHISESTRETEANASQAAALAQQGEQKAAHAAGEIERIAGTVGEASAKIRDLVASADEIGSIAAVIREIAAQTNLLALNAAIEAARAGEQGRGFAVVADEVRGLAERTAGATVQIERMIQTIQSDTVGAVDVMSQVSSQVDNGVAHVRSAADSLHDIREAANSALERIRTVADATKEQTAASTAIAQQVEQIAQMVEGTGAAMAASAASAESLEGLAGELQAMVAQFQY